MISNNHCDDISPSGWIDFEHELRRRHLSSDDFELSVDDSVMAIGPSRPGRNLVVVRHRRRGTVRHYDYITWKTNLIRDVSAGVF
jgi:hypothetical protein